MPSHNQPASVDARLNISRHELAHAMLIELLYSGAVESIALGSREGRTVWQAPVSPATFSRAHEQSSIVAAADVVRIVAIIRLGAYVEYSPDGTIGAMPSGRDVQDLETWHQVVGHDWWNRIYSAAFVGISIWFAHASVQRVLSAMAPVLVHARTMSRY
jgi:hypothetical protein